MFDYDRPVIRHEWTSSLPVEEKPWGLTTNQWRFVRLFIFHIRVAQHLSANTERLFFLIFKV